MYKVFTSITILTVVCLSCQHDSIINADDLFYKTVSDLSTCEDQLLLTGTAKSTSFNPDIKSPFILFLDEELNHEQCVFLSTETTAVGAFSSVNFTREISLGFYSARSLGQQEETSNIYILSEDYQFKKKLSFGHRTRIKSLTQFSQSKLFALSYERQNQKISLRNIINNRVVNEFEFWESDQTNIPTDLLILPNQQIVFSGIADGFHYPDGHNFENPAASGFILAVDSLGVMQNSYRVKGNGHAFIHDIDSDQQFIFMAGTYQSDSTGMDILFGKLDLELKPLWISQINTSGIQEGRKILETNSAIYIVGEIEREDYKMGIQLIKVDNSGNILWQKSFGQQNLSYQISDMVLLNNYLFVAANARENRTSSPIIHIFKMNHDGNLLANKMFDDSTNPLAN